GSAQESRKARGVPHLRARQFLQDVDRAGANRLGPDSRAQRSRCRTGDDHRSEARGLQARELKPRYGSLRGDTYIEITARTTSLPAASVTVTGTATFSAPVHSVLSRRAVAVTSVVALARYSMVMPRGIQRMLTGMVTSVHMPAASSQRFPIASACTVRMWFSTARRLRMDTRHNFGCNSRNRGLMVPK